MSQDQQFNIQYFTQFALSLLLILSSKFLFDQYCEQDVNPHDLPGSCEGKTYRQNGNQTSYLSGSAKLTGTSLAYAIDI